MPRFDNLDTIVNDFAVRIGKAQKDVIVALMEAVEGSTHEEATIILSSLDVNTIMANKTSSALSLFDAGVASMLSNTYTTTMADEQALMQLLLSVKNDLSSKLTQTMPQQLLR